MTTPKGTGIKSASCTAVGNIPLQGFQIIDIEDIPIEEVYDEHLAEHDSLIRDLEGKANTARFLRRAETSLEIIRGRR